MFQANTPEPNELPTPQALIRSTLIAVAVAVAILFVVVLPAEYGIDPTGVGQILGLKRMGEIKVSLTLEAAAAAEELGAGTAATAAAADVPAETAAVADAPAETDARGDVLTTRTAEITLHPDEGKEIKLAMTEGATVQFTWSAAGGGLNYNLHADRTDAPSHSYKQGRNELTDEGEFTAAFDGLHGWFWRNRSGAVVTLSLEVTGEFSELHEPAE